LELLIWLLLAYVAYRMLTGPGRKNQSGGEKGPAGEETHRDPVCGVYVAHDDAVVGNLQGERIYFCSMECLKKFQDRLQQEETGTVDR